MDLASALLEDPKFRVSGFAVGFENEIVAELLVGSHFLVEIDQIRFSYFANLDRKYFGVVALSQKFLIEAIAEFFECGRHFLVKLMVQKCKVELHVVADYRLLLLAYLFHHSRKAHLKVKQFVDPLLSFPASRFLMKLLLQCLCFLVLLPNLFLLRRSQFFFVFFIAEAELHLRLFLLLHICDCRRSVFATQAGTTGSSVFSKCR